MRFKHTLKFTYLSHLLLLYPLKCKLWKGMDLCLIHWHTLNAWSCPGTQQALNKYLLDKQVDDSKALRKPPLPSTVSLSPGWHSAWIAIIIDSALGFLSLWLSLGCDAYIYFYEEKYSSLHSVTLSDYTLFIRHCTRYFRTQNQVLS